MLLVCTFGFLLMGNSVVRFSFGLGQLHKKNESNFTSGFKIYV
jgi:hypothetical protein